MNTQIFKNSKLNFLELRYIDKITQCEKIHLHDELTITAIKKGSLNILFTKQKEILKPKELMIINNYIGHGATLNEESKHGYVLYINKNYLEKLNLFYDKNYEHILYEDFYKNFIDLCELIFDENNSLLFKEENFVCFCLKIFDRFDDLSLILHNTNSNLAYKIKEYLDNNYLEELSLEELSIVFNLSIIHLIRVFKEVFGIPIHSYILNKKVHKAKELLLLNIPIVEVALQSGFFDQSHLNRSFKRVFQITPKQFQKNLKC